MKRITLLRHAKSSWDNPDTSDRERPLNKRGLRDAPMMGKLCSSILPRPDLILSSPALRTRQTISLFLEGWGLTETEGAAVELVEDFYLGGPETLRNITSFRLEGSDHILVCAHQPGIGDFAHWLNRDCPRDIPTSAVFSFRIGEEGLVQGRAFLDYEDRPRKHYAEDGGL